MKEVLKCENLSAGYNGKAIVSGVDLSVHEGEIVTIIGANGAGKSTLLKTIAGLLEIIEGSIFFEGKSIALIPSKDMAKGLAVLLTDKIDADYMSARDVVATGRYAYTGSLGFLSQDDKKAVDLAVSTIGIKDIEDQPFTKLSDGQKQRVMLARAICQNPKMIILDEPTSFLDIGYKIEIMSILRQMADKGIAVLMTMHDLDVAKAVSDKVISIKDGRIDKEGSAEELLGEAYLCDLFGVEIEKYRTYFG